MSETIMVPRSGARQEGGLRPWDAPGYDEAGRRMASGRDVAGDVTRFFFVTNPAPP
ncbi:hypothetical protein [Isosphaera pallida]|uniref:hypothetical protein n=1 Tax=Isosphaera pallida TaxID=128 RepID=UPI00143BE2DE|nr:hypothetical protein [Isosphaera pallida]